MEKNVEASTVAGSSNESSQSGQRKFKLYRKRWAILAVFSLISMTNEVIWISLSSITSIVQEYYRVDSIAVNWLSLVFLIFTVPVLWPCTYFLSRYGLRLTIIVGGVLNAIGSCLRAIGSNRDGFGIVLTGNIIAALGQCFLIFLPPHIAAVWFGKNERATASSIGMLLTFTGVSLGFLSAAFFVPSSRSYDCDVKYGIQQLLLYEAVACTVLALVSIVVVEDAPPTPPSGSQTRRRSKIDIPDGSAKLGESQTRPDDASEASHPSSSITSENTQMTEKIPLKTAAESPKPFPDFKESLLLLAKDRNFFFLSQAYALYFGLCNTYNIITNQMIVARYPGKETQVGYMGCAAALAGLLSMFISGCFIDRTQCYRAFSTADFFLCFLSMAMYTTVLKYVSSIPVTLLAFSIFGFFAYPYIGIGLEHAAEITYPVPAGTSSGVCLILGSLYGILLTYAATSLLECAVFIGGLFMAGCYLLGALLVLQVKSPLKRIATDRYMS